MFLKRRFRNTQITVWLIPLLYATAALLFGFTVPRLAHSHFPGFVSSISVSAAIGIYSAVASGMIALTGIVFSLTFVMVQFSATAYSPRLVLWIARDRVISHAIGVFTATFLYALAALAWVDRGGTGRVPLVGIGVLAGLLIFSVVLFICLIQRVGKLQVNRMFIFTGDQGREIIENLYPPFETSASSGPPPIPLATCLMTLLYRGHPRVVQAVDIPFMTELASKNDCIIDVLVSVGDAVLDSTPLLRVFGAGSSPSEKSLRYAIELGAERTFEQDPKYAIRLLVDIAIKALSPAVNDPTTAVQALDQIEDLLIRLGRRRLEIGAFRDVQGRLRFLIGFPSWEDFLRLAFDEIRLYGAASVQVMRRMKALVTELIEVLPEERRPALQNWQERLRSTVDRSFSDQQDKLEASVADRQGLGSSRRNAPES
jgi:uncharacterized membrane protein